MESTLLNSSADLEHSNAEASSRVVEKLLQLAKWSDIYPYLLENGYIPASQGTEKQAKRALVDLDTYVVALLLCHKFFEGGEPFTLRSLSMAMDGEDFNSIKAMEKRLLRSGFSHVLMVSAITSTTYAASSTDSLASYLKKNTKQGS